jgi:Flp pilus assembly protein TadG
MKKHTIINDTEGATAVEFALVAPVVLLFTIGIIEVSLMMLSQNIMESATFVASRLGKTGYTEGGATREETIMQAVEDSASGLLDTSRITITSLSYDQFGDVGRPEPFVDANANGQRDDGENFTDVNGNGAYDNDMGSGDAGESGDVVVYTVSYPWHINTPIMSAVIGTNGIFSLTARTVVKNEPF